MYANTNRSNCGCQSTSTTSSLLVKLVTLHQCGKSSWKSIDLEPPIALQSNVYLGCKQEPEVPDQDAIAQKSLIYQGFFMMKHAQDAADAERIAPKGAESSSTSTTTPKTLLKEEKCLRRDNASKSTSSSAKAEAPDIKGYNYSMCGHVEQCVDKYLELANKKVSELKQVGTPCIDDHDITSDELVNRGELADQSARIVLKALYVARISRPDVYFAVNTLAREVTR